MLTLMSSAEDNLSASGSLVLLRAIFSGGVIIFQHFFARNLLKNDCKVLPMYMVILFFLCCCITTSLQKWGVSIMRAGKPFVLLLNHYKTYILMEKIWNKI